jgi:hypothetical protein
MRAPVTTLRLGSLKLALCEKHTGIAQTGAVILGKAAFVGLGGALARARPDLFEVARLGLSATVAVARASRPAVRPSTRIEYDEPLGDDEEPEAPRRRYRDDDVIEGEIIKVTTVKR